MAADTLRFFLDENVPVAIAGQLRRHGIEVVTVRDLDALGESDVNHLQWAMREGYVVCTHDRDFLQMASSGLEHAGIVFGQQHRRRIGDWVKLLVLAHAVYSPEEMHNHIEYL